MSILELITSPFIMFFQVAKILFSIDPIGTILLSFVSVYWSVNLILLNKPITKVLPFGLFKFLKKQERVKE